MQYYDLPAVSVRAAMWQLMRARVDQFNVSPEAGGAPHAVCPVCRFALLCLPCRCGWVLAQQQGSANPTRHGLPLWPALRPTLVFCWSVAAPQPDAARLGATASPSGYAIPGAEPGKEKVYFYRDR